MSGNLFSTRNGKRERKEGESLAFSSFPEKGKKERANRQTVPAGEGRGEKGGKEGSVGSPLAAGKGREMWMPVDCNKW